jgi:hypothetical protein
MYYLEFPFLISLGSKNAKVYFGPQYSALLKSDIEGIKENDFGIKYGLGFDTNGRLLLRFFAYTGLTNMLPVDMYKLKHRYIHVSVGFKLIKSTYVMNKKDIPHRALE